MNFSFYIARRYLFSKKKHNAINIISGISVCGVALATLALVCTLSVFNGFQDMVASFFTAFDPQLKITVREGKVFDAQDERIRAVCELPEVEVFTETLEENAMVQYKDRQAMVVLKGVEDNFEELTAIDSILYGAGEFVLHDSIVNYGVMGVELVATLGTGLEFVDPLQVYLPKRNAKVNMANPGASFNRDYLYSPGVVFVVNQQEYDGKYILTSLDFLRQLLDYTTEVSAMELKLKPNVNTSSVQSKIENILGDDFVVQNRYQQQADVFRIMEIEKLISYLFLTFILMIACFNVIGSLSMLILDKKDDVVTLRSLGASDKLISRKRGLTAAGTVPDLHRIPLHRQADMPSRLPIPGGKIKTFYILFSFFFLIIFFFLHFVFLSVVFLCFCKCFRLADVEPTAVLKRITLYAGCFAHG
mgnify:CR=1 FL=1